MAARNFEVDPPVMDTPPSKTAIMILNIVVVATLEVAVPVRRMLKNASKPLIPPVIIKVMIFTLSTLTPD